MANKYIYAIGRRKSSTATVRLIPGGKGDITINNMPALDYFDGSKTLEARYLNPLKLLEKISDYDITIRVKGGGVSGQADAIKLGIAKTLASMDDTNRATLKKAGFLKRDPRERERKKYGLKSARKKEQFSKR